MIKVNVAIDNKQWLKKVKNPKKYLTQKLKKISKLLKLKKKIILTVLLTNSVRLKKLNKKFRKKNKSTDVLSFPSFSQKKIKHVKEKKIYIGDIAISYEIIYERCRKKSFLLEFDKIWVHGLLHLIGFNHVKNKDFYKMNKIEKRILSSI